ncbi:Mitochondrial fission process protein 1 [Chamberlinius hualienensis]
MEKSDEKSKSPLNVGSSNTSGITETVDIYRDTPIRLLGYANEVGEAFRSLVPLSLVRLSYAIASGYVVADTVDKALKMFKNSDHSASTNKRNKQVAIAAVDCLIWQSLASVIIPGFTINRACAISLYAFSRFTKLPLTTRKWTTTIIGLSTIPFIIKPIDHSVDFLMDNTMRKYTTVKSFE